MKYIYLLQQDYENYIDTSIYYDFDDAAANGIIILGGRNFISYKSQEYERIEKYFDELVNEFEHITAGDGYAVYNSLSVAVAEYFPKANGGRYSTREIHEIKNIINQYNGYAESIAAPLLSIITGKEYTARGLRGYSQGDYVDIIYPAGELNNDDIKYIEAIFFGTGSEYKIIESKSPLTLDEIQQTEDYYFDYFHEWSADEIKNKIATREELPRENIKIFEISRRYRVTHYEYTEI